MLGLIERCALKKEIEKAKERGEKKKMKSSILWSAPLTRDARTQSSKQLWVFGCFDQIIPSPCALLVENVFLVKSCVCLGFDFFQSKQMTVASSLANAAFQSIVSPGCPREQLHRCVKTAEPLLRNPDYVVPSTTTDVMIHCRSLFPQDKFFDYHFLVFG